MIYVSSSAIRAVKIKDSVESLCRSGFLNIELSGGTRYYEGFENDLLELKAKYGINYLCHNYFPPPQTDFVLNIASLDPEISERSVEHILKAIHLSKLLGAKRFGFHAGFLIDIPVQSVGKRIEQLPLFDRERCVEQFSRNYELVSKQAEGIDLYIENNVLSAENFRSFGNVNPFFICETSGFEEFSEKIRYNLLLDMAHLFVSCKTLGIDFQEESAALLKGTDYIHVSDNNGLRDSNEGLKEGGEIHRALATAGIAGKIVTLEVYSGLEEIQKTYRQIQYLLENA